MPHGRFWTASKRAWRVMALGTAIWPSAHHQKPSTCQRFDSTCINFFTLLNAISTGSYSNRFCEQMLQLKTSNQRDNNGKPSLFMVHLLIFFHFNFKVSCLGSHFSPTSSPRPHHLHLEIEVLPQAEAAEAPGTKGCRCYKPRSL